MRKLMYLAIGFAAACIVQAYGWKWSAGAALLAVTIAVISLVGRDGTMLRRALVMLLGAAAGFAWFDTYDRVYLSTARAIDGQVCFAEIRVSDFSRETSYGTSVDGTVILEGKPYQVRLWLREDQPAAPGDYLYGDFRFRLTVPDGGAESQYYQGKGIFLLGYAAGDVRLEDYDHTRRDFPARVRRKVGSILQEVFPEDTAGFARALLLGDTSGMDYQTDTNFKISGIRHVVAVSGLHVSILFSLLGMVAFRKRFLMAALGFPVLFLFAAVAGFTPSVTRSCLMSGLMLLSMLVNREYDGPTALGFAVLVILLGNPLSAVSVSLQLSVASVAGIFLFEPGIRSWLLSLFGERKRRKIEAFFIHGFCLSVSVTLSAMVFTTPLCAWYFGTVSLVGPVTNLLALWVVSFIFYGLMAVCGVYFLAPSAAVILAKAVSVPIRYVLLVAKSMASLPMAAVYTASGYIVFWLVFVYLLLLIFLLSSKRRPGVLFCCAVIGLCFAQLAGWNQDLGYDTTFTVLDVGQGQCLVFRSGDMTCMVDCGGDSSRAAADAAAAWLLSRGMDHLDCLILTHMDEDHAEGAWHLLSRIPTELLILPAVPSQLPPVQANRTVWAQEDLTVDMGNAKIRIFPPTFPGKPNEISLCILFDTENCDILITGDRTAFGERALLRNGNIPDVDILVAGHHGSKTSTCDALLEAVRPEIVCISAGDDNPYGHPHREVLQRLTDFGCSVYRTDLHGTITFRR